MVNPGAFKGARKEFLLGEKPAYVLAVEGCFAADAIATIQRQFFLRFPIDMADDDEPSPEEIAAINDGAAMPEVEEPDPEKMSPEEYQTAMKALEERQARLAFKKAQIKRWMAYQYSKDHDLDPTETSAYNPYQALLAKLIGKNVDCLRLKTATNVWRKTERTAIEAKSKDIHEASKKKSLETGEKVESLIAIRDRVARSMFANLPSEEQALWEQQAIDEHNAALEEWKNLLKKRPSEEPAERQRCIQGLVQFVQPILDLLSDATGWKVSMITGGPEPAMGGQMNIVSIHSGTTTGDVKMNFGHAQRTKFRGTVVPLYGAFLQSCYSPEVCRSRALPANEGYIPIADLGLKNETSDFDPIPWDAPAGGQVAARNSPTPAPASSANKGGPSRNERTQLPTKTAAVPSEDGSPPVTSSVAPKGNEKNAQKGKGNGKGESTNTQKGKENGKGESTSIQKGKRNGKVENTNAGAAPRPSGAVAVPLGLMSPAAAITMRMEGVVSSDSTSDSMVASAAPNGFPTAVSPAPPPAPQPVDVEGVKDISVDNPFPFAFEDESSPPSRAPSLPPSPAHSLPPSPAHSRSNLPPVGLEAPVQAMQNDLPAVSQDSGAVKGPPVTANVVTPAPEIDAMEVDTGGSLAVDENSATSVPRRSTRRSNGAEDASSQGNNVSGGKGRKRGADQAVASVDDGAEGVQRKRLRMSALQNSQSTATTASIPSPELELLPNAPAWFKNARDMFLSEDLGAQWKTLVDGWGQFEAMGGYSGSKKLRSSGRPAVVGDWIQCARSTKWRPKSLNTTQYHGQFMGWWQSLQPEWRISTEGTIRMAATEGDWGMIRKGGLNGLVSVVAALFFWGHVNGSDTDEWINAVKEVTVVFECLVSSK